MSDRLLLFFHERLFLGLESGKIHPRRGMPPIPRQVHAAAKLSVPPERGDGATLEKGASAPIVWLIRCVNT
jgi:hypothetical protein